MVVLSALTFSGCDNQRIIVHEKKEQTRPKGMALGSPQAPKQASRMFIAIYEHGQTLWTFKIVEPTDALRDESRWRPFIEGIDFDEEGKPVWQLPEGWQAGGSSQFVFSRIRIPGDPPLEIVVSDLPANQDMAANVNRWRDQLTLPPFTDELSNHLQSKVVVKNGEERRILIFDEEGFFAGAGMRTQSRPPATMPVGIDYWVPDEWTKKDSPSQMITRFQKGEGEDRIEISVTQLPSQAVSWSEVANMWASQLGTEALAEHEVMERTSITAVNGFEGFRIEFEGLDAEEKRVLLLGAVVKGSPFSWYFKVVGPQELVAGERETLTKVIESVKLKQ
ncbi:MAG TPA: hypothetical protein PKD64_16655 [Pirellulaceae bacterium]|nr:hypothetical protein [Pirellulaceae bacterium]